MTEALLIVGIKHLGRDIALHFARQGWRVICAARTAHDVEALAADVDAAGGAGVPLVCDLTDSTSLAQITAHRIDLCVAAQSAGGRFGSRGLLEIDDEELARGLATYVHGTWNLLKAVGPKMIEQRAGTFLQIGTSSGVRTKEGFAALGATQQALRALVQVAAKEWRTHGVHVAYVPIDAPIERGKTRANGRETAAMLSPTDIARACEYLHSQDPRGWTHELVLRPQASEWSAPT